MTEIGALIAVAVTFGLIAGMIAYSRTGQAGAFWGLFILGTIVPIIGVVVACLVKAPTAAPQPPGWYTDPWGQAHYRYYDGAQWTYHMSDGLEAAP